MLLSRFREAVGFLELRYRLAENSLVVEVAQVAPDELAQEPTCSLRAHRAAGSKCCRRMRTFFQWDDHDVMNNWSSSKDLASDSRYTEKSIARLAARASRAFHEMTPIRSEPSEPGRVYRKISHGPLLDVFFLDMRSYRGPNGPNLETELTDRSRILGRDQVRWLKGALAGSDAVWKIIASDMPLGLVVWDDAAAKTGSDATSNGENGAPKGREMEIADLLRFIKSSEIKNTVWLTADVHYTAAHYYNPGMAKFQDFEPFREFVSGPIHSGTFGPNELDMTFGPELRFIKEPTKDQSQNLPPSMGLQFFGLIDISGTTEQMTVRLMDRDDHELYRVVLDPQSRR